MCSAAGFIQQEAQAWPDFERQLAALRRAQQAFAARPVIERAALLHDLADKLAQARSRLAEMVCEEWDAACANVRPSWINRVALIRYYARLAPQLLAHKTIATQAS